MIVDSPAALLDLIGVDLGATGWVEVTGERIALFVEATNGPAEHNFLALSLVNLFLPELLTVRGASMGVNVGLDTVRFPSPVAPGCRVRGRGEIVAAAEAKGGVQITVRVVVERAGPDDGAVDPPACVADTVSRFLP